jgi:aryl-alcohol dehydrogenase-like predicted oxidoreductase
VLFHREADAVHLDVLEGLKSRGWLAHAGISCDNCPGPAGGFVADGRAAALQIPGNILDRRHQASGILQSAADRGVAVFLRSVYLQGLLLMPESEIPAALREVIPARQRLEAIATAGGISLAELAVRTMLAQNGIACVLTGVETLAQLRENLAIFARGALAADMLAAVDATPIDLPELVLTPSQWPAA